MCFSLNRVAWQNSKPVSCKMHAFLQNAISFAVLYSGFVLTNIQALYTTTQLYIFPMLGLRFLQGTGIEKPNYMWCNDFEVAQQYFLLLPQKNAPVYVNISLVRNNALRTQIKQLLNFRHINSSSFTIRAVSREKGSSYFPSMQAFSAHVP